MRRSNSSLARKDSKFQSRMRAIIVNNNISGETLSMKGLFFPPTPTPARHMCTTCPPAEPHGLCPRGQPRRRNLELHYALYGDGRGERGAEEINWTPKAVRGRRGGGSLKVGPPFIPFAPGARCISYTVARGDFSNCP